MTARTVMVQGTASSAGKSIIAAALCRIFHQRGYRVAPFKSQNMALNSFVTREGGEIGRAQAVQAEAAGIEATVDMNPVLLKPEADAMSQVIVLGKVAGKLKAEEYYEHTPDLLKVVVGALDRLCAVYDVIVIEGAGSPAEVNLKEQEIANMRIAYLRQTPVLLVGDIDRGGVFASLVGTLELLGPEDRELIKGFVINKFRGNLDLLRPGLDFLEQRTGKPVLGVIPYSRDVAVAQEDSVYLDERRRSSVNGGLDVVVIRLPRVANYDDFDPLEEAGCSVRYVRVADELGMPDMVILPGTKSTMADLEYVRHQGLDRAIMSLAEAGTPVVGICGGYQMLGRVVSDPGGVEGIPGSVPGLGLLDIDTVFRPEKRTVQVEARVVCDTGLFAGLGGMEVGGYEIHMGVSSGDGRPLFRVTATPQGSTDYPDGRVSGSGLVFGTYIHGLFHNAEFARRFLENVRRLRKPDALLYQGRVHDDRYNRLARLVRENLDMGRVYEIVFGRR
ncbi:MAG: cobyric acid synthase [Chloroflexota bacterium]